MDERMGRRAVLGLPLLGAAALAGCSSSRRDAQDRDQELAFPEVPTAALTPHQRRVVEVLRAEHAALPEASRYTPVEGEPWCADFVSWVERAAGTPLRNPNGGGWRIPGTMALLDHLRSTGAWHPAGSGYTPAVADIAIYDTTSPFSQHTNFVLGLSGGVLTTCGGNEWPRRINVSRHRLDASLHCLGFGHRV